MKVRCPACTSPLEVPDGEGGNLSTCPRCGATFRLPYPVARPVEEEPRRGPLTVWQFLTVRPLFFVLLVVALVASCVALNWDRYSEPVPVRPERDR